MTGTVLDGNIDIALLRTDGEYIEEFGPYALIPYSYSTRVLLEKTLDAAQLWKFDKEEPDIFAQTEVAITGSQTKAIQEFIKTSKIDINDMNQTNIPNIFAIGDVSGAPWLAHRASSQAHVAVGHMLGKSVRKLENLLIPGCTYCEPQVASLGLTEENAIKTIQNAEEAISALNSNISINTKERINEAKDALNSGDSALAKGLANSIIREINTTSEAMNKVQKALRQRVKLESKMPTGKSNSEWMSKLDSIVTASNNGDWIKGSKELDELTSALRDFEEEMKEANELLSFIEEEWTNVRKKLDSAGINAQDNTRISIENNISDIIQFLKEGEIKPSLSLLAESDLLIEEIRRRI